MNAFESIVSKKPRENAGPLAANRFVYQLDWGLKKLSICGNRPKALIRNAFAQ